MPPRHARAIAHLKAADPVLGAWIDAAGPCAWRAERDGTHFDHIARSIVYQQLSGAAASTIYWRVLALYGGRAPTPAELLDTPDDDLRAAGLSRQKIGYLRDLAHRVHTGDVPLENVEALGDDEVIAALTRIKGVGRWTAQMFLMFRLGRPDVLPELDLGVQKGLQLAYRKRALPTPKDVQRIGAAWAPYRSVASWYLWRLLDNGDGQGG